jgi:hypothetical protein
MSPVAQTPKRKTRREEEPPYARYAFLNPYNLTLLLAVAITSVATGHYWMAIIGAALELMWMLFAPDSKLLRATVFDEMWKRKQKFVLEDARNAKLAELAPEERERFASLALQRQRIEQLANDNPSLTTELMESELAKLEALLDDFLGLALLSSRCEKHLQSFDFAALQRSWSLYEHQVQSFPTSDPRRAVAEKNLDVLKKRRQRWEELQATHQTSRGQMDLMEQTFRLLGDDIVTANPGELGVRLDELRIGVDAIREAQDDESTDAYAFQELEEQEARQQHEQRTRH